jgi:hypothetical protein
LVSSHRVFYKFNLGVVKNNQFVYWYNLDYYNSKDYKLYKEVD